MYTINISFKIEHHIIDDWKGWISETLLPMVTGEPGITGYGLFSLVGHDDEYGATYILQFNIQSEENLTAYLENWQHKIHGKIHDKWGEKAPFFQTILKKVSQ